MKQKRAIVAWSGGIDSTALIGQLLCNGWEVEALTFDMYTGDFARREIHARQDLCPMLARLGAFSASAVDAGWMWAFAIDGKEIPRRNKYIIDYMIAYAQRSESGVKDIGVGQYVGADTWVVQDHVGAEDCDARSLTAYVYREYGMGWKLWTLSDFGEARYKHHRLAMGFKADIDMSKTTNCLSDSPIHCGLCYKCIERSVAFKTLRIEDPTEYIHNPALSSSYLAYLDQMRDEPMTLTFEQFKADVNLPEGSS